MLHLVGLIFLYGYNIGLSEKDCWSINLDLCCDAFPETMTQNRFFELKSFFHAAGNHSLCDSRMAKVKPFHNLLNQMLQVYGIFQKDLCIDESLVLYYGHQSGKQFICAEAIRFGYKLWVLASATRLPYSVEIYAGKLVNDIGEPLGTCMVKNALEVCKCPSNHHVHFDNFFSS